MSLSRRSCTVSSRSVSLLPLLLLLAPLLLLAAAPAEPLAAQDAAAAPSLEAGTRVRVRHESGEELIGDYVGRSGGSLVVRSGDDRLRVPEEDVEGVDVSLGAGPDPGRGAVVGAIAGGLLGLAAGLAASTDDDAFIQVEPQDVMLASVLLSGIGAGVGALVGLAVPIGERWAPVEPGPVALAVSPTTVIGARRRRLGRWSAGSGTDLGPVP